MVNVTAEDHGAYYHNKFINKATPAVSPHHPKQHFSPTPASVSTSSISMNQEPDYHSQPKVIGNYSLTESLGKGSMGKVKLGVHNVTGDKVCKLCMITVHNGTHTCLFF
jgi:hypothetical protein